MKYLLKKIPSFNKPYLFQVSSPQKRPDQTVSSLEQKDKQTVRLESKQSLLKLNQSIAIKEKTQKINIENRNDTKSLILYLKQNNNAINKKDYSIKLNNDESVTFTRIYENGAQHERTIRFTENKDKILIEKHTIGKEQNLKKQKIDPFSVRNLHKEIKHIIGKNAYARFKNDKYQ